MIFAMGLDISREIAVELASHVERFRFEQDDPRSQKAPLKMYVIAQ